MQGEVAVSVHLADRDTQPVGRADLYDRLDGQAKHLRPAHPGAGQDLDCQTREWVWVVSGCRQ
jgi:hypothetical protein